MSDKDMVKIEYHKAEEEHGIYINGVLICKRGSVDFTDDGWNDFYLNDEWRISVQDYIQAAGTCVWERDEKTKQYKASCGRKKIKGIVPEIGFYTHCPNCGRCIEERVEK